MQHNPDDVLAEARRLWDQDKAVDAGRLIFERLPAANRAMWACDILRVSVERTGVKPAPVSQLLDLCARPSDWSKAHAAFSTIRQMTLRYEERKSRSDRSSLILDHLYLAENVAKVLYNSTNPLARFDHDAGYWIVASLKRIVDAVGDAKFSKEAWSAVVS